MCLNLSRNDFWANKWVDSRLQMNLFISKYLAPSYFKPFVHNCWGEEDKKSKIIRSVPNCPRLFWVCPRVLSENRQFHGSQSSSCTISCKCKKSNILMLVQNLKVPTIVLQCEYNAFFSCIFVMLSFQIWNSFEYCWRVLELWCQMTNEPCLGCFLARYLSFLLALDQR